MQNITDIEYKALELAVSVLKYKTEEITNRTNIIGEFLSRCINCALKRDSNADKIILNDGAFHDKLYKTTTKLIKGKKYYQFEFSDGKCMSSKGDQLSVAPCSPMSDDTLFLLIENMSK